MKAAGSAVVVTGGTGFLGRHVAADMQSAGATVHALGTADYDLRKRPAIDAMLRDLQPDAVVHLAAVVGGIGANRAEPGRFLYENALMGIELLEACREAATSKVIVAGTVCAYPKFTPLPFAEDTLWDGYPEETNAPYGVAKRLLLVQGQAYREQYGMNVVHLLPVNLYGPHDSFDLEQSHVIPGMIRKFVEARDRGEASVVLWGDGSPTREFLHVFDAARAFRLALERYDGSEPINIGSGREISIADLATTVATAVGFTGDIVWDATKPNGQPRRCLDTTRARDLLGFEASVDFADGIRETVDWYQTSMADSANPV
jgi:GDP-L-fucose synthase